MDVFILFCPFSYLTDLSEGVFRKYGSDAGGSLVSGDGSGNEGEFFMDGKYDWRSFMDYQQSQQGGPGRGRWNFLCDYGNLSWLLEEYAVIFFCVVFLQFFRFIVFAVGKDGGKGLPEEKAAVFSIYATFWCLSGRVVADAKGRFSMQGDEGLGKGAE